MALREEVRHRRWALFSSACYSGCDPQLSVPAGMPLFLHHDSQLFLL